MTMINPFSPSAFDSVSLTAAINILPNRYGRVGELNIMPGKGVRTRTIAVEERNGTLTLLPTAKLGSAGTVGTQGKRTVRSFVIPHIPHDDVVLPEEVQGIRAFGSESELQGLSEVMAMHLQAMRDKHAITLEWLRMGALKGEILDADGSTIYNLFTEFGISPKQIDFELDDSTTDVRQKCLNLKRHIEDNLKGEIMSNIHCLVSADFFDELTSHAKVVAAYNLYQNGAALRDDMRTSFTFAGVTFEEYRGSATTPSGSTVKFIDDGYGYAYPQGTSSTFATYFAPADFNETANTLGQELYAKIDARKYERGTDLHTQSNPLPICHRPAVLVELLAH